MAVDGDQRFARDELLYETTGFSTFTLTGATTPTLTLRPSLSGDYAVHVAIITDAGPTILRTFVVHIAGPGLYWSGTGVVRPVVSIYCGGQRKATFGVAPDLVPGFDQSGGNPLGDLWRVADVTITSGGADCTVTPLHPPGMTEGYYVTFGSVTH